LPLILITEEERMFSSVSKSASRFVVLAVLALTPVALIAQVVPAAQGSPRGNYASKWDIFAGYSFLAPSGTVVTNIPVANTNISYDNVNFGEIASVSLFFNRYIGIQGEVGIHEWGIQNTNPIGAQGTHGNNDGFTNATGGLIFRRPSPRFTPFVHAGFGGALVDGSAHNYYTWGQSVTAGGGLDYETPWLNHHLAIRIIQADYEFMHVYFNSVKNVYPAQGVDINAARLSAGIVFHIDEATPPTPVDIACSPSPVTVYPGDPVTVTATAGGLNPKLNAVYTWSGAGVSGTGTTATVATGALAPGSYTVKCGVKEGKPGKEGLKPWESAEATASFNVKAFEPPTISCSAAPSTIKPGETSAITASGVSPQNRPLTYTGSVSGTGSSATYSSTGAPTGAVGITCTVSDDKGQTATANTGVTISAPYVPPTESPEVKQLETRLALHSIFFQTDEPRIGHPKGGLMSSQEEILTTLATDFKRYLELKPDAHLTLTGHADVRGSVQYNQALSERRVGHTKSFLVEQGVPETKIETLGLGKEEDLTAAQVEDAVKQNPGLSDTEREKLLHNLPVIILAKNRRVDVTLSTTGQQSVQWYPFNAADAKMLLDQRNLTKGKKAATPQK
jgi:outer membrane protein OmpA-like peptidoglycan-associated protein